MEAVGYAILDIRTLFAGFALGFIVFSVGCYFWLNETGRFSYRNYFLILVPPSPAHVQLR
ncbi:MAG: hypothetical protein RR962_03225 [Hafnia sp.]